ncbi:MAG: DUF3185 family protein [Verrucomicrobia bacterium]|nr:DUF3185 family protein [Verrucomicrobiota bacterium]
MNKLLSLALMAGGVVLVILGINVTNSSDSDIYKFFTEASSGKAIWMVVGGVAAAIVGFCGALHRARHG